MTRLQVLSLPVHPRAATMSVRYDSRDMLVTACDAGECAVVSQPRGTVNGLHHGGFDAVDELFKEHGPPGGLSEISGITGGTVCN